MISRRSWFKALAGAAAVPVVAKVIPQAKAETPRVEKWIGTDAEGYSGVWYKDITPELIQDRANKLALMAAERVEEIVGQRFFPRIVAAPDEHPCKPGDVIAIPVMKRAALSYSEYDDPLPDAFSPRCSFDCVHVSLEHYTQASLELPDWMELFDDEKMLRRVAAVVKEHADRFTESIWFCQRAVAFGLLPSIMPSLGAITGHGITERFYMRAVLSYSHVGLGHHLTFDTLYGAV